MMINKKMKIFVMECDIECFRALRVKIAKVGSCLVSNTGASNPILNCVYNFNGNNARTETDIKQILAELKVSGLSHCWWTETSLESPQVREILIAHHKMPVGEFLGMALDMSEIKIGSAMPDFKISRVLTDSDFAAWGRIIAEAFEFSESDEKLYTSLFVKAGADGPFYHLVGKKNDKVDSQDGNSHINSNSFK